MAADLMTFNAYATHRRARGLPGGTRRAVQKAAESGRLDGAVVDTPDGRRIDPAAADAAWSRRTDREQQDRGQRGGAPIPESIPGASEVVEHLNRERARLTGLRADELQRRLDGEGHGGVITVAAVVAVMECAQLAMEGAIVTAATQIAIELQASFGLSEFDTRRLMIAIDHGLRGKLREAALRAWAAEGYEGFTVQKTEAK